MKQEDKKLLIQDIMARLPYDPKFDLDGVRGSIHHIHIYPKYNGNKIEDCICSVDFFGDGNYIDIEQVKSILNDFTFEDIMEQLYTPVYLNNRYKNIPNFNQFIEYYEKELLKHTNKNTITGYDCFELSLEE